jgi:SAM-dependent methyltransferase
LDAACGPGLYLRELLARGAEVSAFDASPVMVALARQRTAERLRIDQAALGERGTHLLLLPDHPGNRHLAYAIGGAAGSLLA